jgi:hypothetical protein
MSVDRIFTTLIQRAFTNAFDAVAAHNLPACLCSRCNAD